MIRHRTYAARSSHLLRPDCIGPAYADDTIMTPTSPQTHSNSLPFLTADIPGVPAAIKRRYEDFQVEEIAAYEPSGSGDHTYFTIEKRGLATMRAVNDIARALGVPAKNIGLAGLKDARAVTVQTLSIEHTDPERVRELDIPRIKILNVTRHGNKLKIGHLRGNRFRIRLRQIEGERTGDIRAVCETLVTRGVPNYFGSQRFGSRGDTWEIGRAVLMNDPKTAVDLILGTPGPFDKGEVFKARRLYEAGDFAGAAKAWPYGFRDNVRMCRELDRTKGKHNRAFHAVDMRMKKFYVNAFQSYLFNLVLARRINEIDQIKTGDLAFKHENGAVFRVEDAAAESPRAAAFDISPTGPIYGFKMTEPEGEPAAIESEVLAGQDLKPDDFRAMARMKIHGARRPLRFKPEGLEIDDGQDQYGPYVELRFTLSSGCYATMILAEVCKQHLEEGLEDDQP